jgi:hypothetical protein
MRDISVIFSYSFFYWHSDLKYPRSNVTVEQARGNDWCLRTVVSQES